MSQIETTQKLTNSFAGLKHCGDSHNYPTKSKTKRLPDKPHANTQISGTQFVKYNCSYNGMEKFQKQFSQSTSTPMQLYPSKKSSEKCFN